MSEPRESPTASGGARLPGSSQDAGSVRVVEPRGFRSASGSEQDADPRRNGAVSQAERQHLRQALASLTPREQDVVEAVWAGGSNEAVAERMCVAIPTLRTHLMRIHRKLGTRGKGDLIRFVAEQMLEGYRAGRLNGVPSRSQLPSAPPQSQNAKSSVSMTTAAAESSQ